MHKLIHTHTNIGWLSIPFELRFQPVNRESNRNVDDGDDDEKMICSYHLPDGLM